MDNTSSYNQTLQNTDFTNNSIYQKSLEAVNKKDGLIDSLIQEPISLASGEILQRGLSRVGGALSATGKKLGFDLDGVADMIKKGGKPQDILRQALSDGGQQAYQKAQDLLNKVNPPTQGSINERFKNLTTQQKNIAMSKSKNLGLDDFEGQNKILDDIQSSPSLQNLKSGFKKPTSLSKVSDRLNKLVDKSQGILDDSKNKLQQRKTQLQEGLEDRKESGTSFRDIVNKSKERIFGSKKVPFENELTKSEQLDNIKQQLAKSKQGRKQLKQTVKQEAKAKLQEVDKQKLRDIGLEPLEQPQLGEERPQGTVKGQRKPRTIQEKSKEGIASNEPDPLLPEEDEQDRLKNIREEREIQGGFREPQDQDFLKQQSLRETGYKEGENIATRDSKPISQILQETIQKTAPKVAPKPVPKPVVEPEPEPVVKPEIPPKPKFDPKKTGVKVMDVEKTTDQENIFNKPTSKLDLMNKLSSLDDNQKTTYSQLRRGLSVEPNDYDTKNRLIDHVLAGTVPEELQTAPSLESQVGSSSSSSSGSAPQQEQPQKIEDTTQTFQEQQDQSKQDDNITRQEQLKKSGDDEEEAEPEEDEEDLGETAGMDIAGEFTGGLSNLGMGLGLMLLPKLFESRPDSPTPITLQQETNPSSQFGDS